MNLRLVAIPLTLFPSFGFFFSSFYFCLFYYASLFDFFLFFYIYSSPRYNVRAPTFLVGEEVCCREKAHVSSHIFLKYFMSLCFIRIFLFSFHSSGVILQEVFKKE
jgi:hypothetical protein